MHFNKTTTDYNIRIINSADKTLAIYGDGGTAATFNLTGTMNASVAVNSTGTMNASVAVNSASFTSKVASPTTTPVTGTETASGTFESGFSSGVYSGVRTLFHTSVLQGSGSRGVIAVQTSSGGAYTRYFFDQSGNATAPGTWVNTSDERLKDEITRIEDPLTKMKLIKGVTWKRLDGVSPGIGFIAQDVQAVFPDNVFVTGSRTLEDGTVVDNVLSPDTAGVAAALHHEAILALMEKIETLEARLAETESGS